MLSSTNPGSTLSKTSPCQRPPIVPTCVLASEKRVKIINPPPGEPIKKATVRVCHGRTAHSLKASHLLTCLKYGIKYLVAGVRLVLEEQSHHKEVHKEESRQERVRSEE